MHETDGKQEYVNNLCGKEILQLKGNSIPVARVFTLACADEHLLRNLESLVAVQ